MIFLENRAGFSGRALDGGWLRGLASAILDLIDRPNSPANVVPQARSNHGHPGGLRTGGMAPRLLMIAAGCTRAPPWGGTWPWDSGRPRTRRYARQNNSTATSLARATVTIGPRGGSQSTLGRPPIARPDDARDLPAEPISSEDSGRGRPEGLAKRQFPNAAGLTEIGRRPGSAACTKEQPDAGWPRPRSNSSGRTPRRTILCCLKDAVRYYKRAGDGMRGLRRSNPAALPRGKTRHRFEPRLYV